INNPLSQKVVDGHPLDAVHAAQVQHARGGVRVIAETGYTVVRNPKVRAVYTDVRNSAAVQNEHIVRLARKGKDGRRGARNALVAVLRNKGQLRLNGALIRGRVEGNRAGSARGNDHRVGGTVTGRHKVIPNPVG